MIMSPVADGDLHQFMLSPVCNDRDSLLQTSFGCLTGAVAYLHSNRIRHKDIKPSVGQACNCTLTHNQNILVKAHYVLLTDFGISRDWTQAGRSTTTGPASRTGKCCAPEVSEGDARNSTSDMWSLGCVFLEIWSILCGSSLDMLGQHMRNNGSKSSIYHSNSVAAASWCDKLQSDIDFEGLSKPTVWMSWMLDRHSGLLRTTCMRLSLLTKKPRMKVEEVSFHRNMLLIPV
jgi:serine/threonine protein kinase